VGKDGAPAALVPAGNFTMGDDESSPVRTLFVDAFYMDRFETTTGRYAKFLESTGSDNVPEFWDEIAGKDSEDMPVIGVSWNEANAYCRWAGKRLPTETEWEKAARGTDGRRFPWGNGRKRQVSRVRSPWGLALPLASPEWVTHAGRVLAKPTARSGCGAEPVDAERAALRAVVESAPRD